MKYTVDLPDSFPHSKRPFVEPIFFIIEFDRFFPLFTFSLKKTVVWNIWVANVAFCRVLQPRGRYLNRDPPNQSFKVFRPSWSTTPVAGKCDYLKISKGTLSTSFPNSFWCTTLESSIE